MSEAYDEYASMNCGYWGWCGMREGVLREGRNDPPYEASQVWNRWPCHSDMGRWQVSQSQARPRGRRREGVREVQEAIFEGPAEPKSGRKWLFGRRIMDSSRRCTILGMIWHPCLKSPLQKLNQSIVQVCQDDRMDGQRGNGHCKGSLDLFLLQCYDSGQLLLKNEWI